jgi:predicted site-specific integrase-resolvase
LLDIFPLDNPAKLGKMLVNFIRKLHRKGENMKAAGYIRVSTEDQAKEGVSLENQKAKIRAYAELKDLELTEIIEDAGISAKNLRRPGMQRVLQLARSGEIKAVIVFKLDRMFRSTVDALETTQNFDRWVTETGKKTFPKNPK